MFYLALVLVASFLLLLKYLHERKGDLLKVILWIGFNILVAALIAGEVINGFFEAEGFNIFLFFVGVIAVALVYLFKTSVLSAGWLKERLVAMREAIRLDLRDETSKAASKTVAHVACLLVVLVVVYFIFLVLIYANANLADCPRPFINTIRETAARLPLQDVLLLNSCVDKLIFNPVSIILYWLVGGSSEYESIILFFKFNVGIVLIIITINSILYIKKQRVTLVALSSFCLLLVLIGGDRIFVDDFIEISFSLFFFVNFLMAVNLRYTFPYLLLAGLVTGLTLAVKEVNVINLVLILALIFFKPLGGRQRLKSLAGFLGGLAVGMLPTVLYSACCGQTEGLSHMPYLFFRGYSLISLSQEYVCDLIAGGFEVTIVDVIKNRLTFQTIGEILVGGTVALSPICLTLFPVPYLLANLEKEKVRAMGLFLAVAMLFYGLSFWKRGDASNPVFTMIAFGYIFYGPYLVRLARKVVSAIRERQLFGWRNLYILVLAGLNVVFLVLCVSSLARYIPVFRHVDSIDFRRVAFEYTTENELVDHLRALGTERRSVSLLSEGCSLGDLYFLALSGVRFPIQTLDSPISFIEALNNRDRKRILFLKDIVCPAGAQDALLLVCTRSFQPHQDLLEDGCVEVICKDLKESGMVLLRFDFMKCTTQR